MPVPEVPMENTGECKLNLNSSFISCNFSSTEIEDDIKGCDVNNVELIASKVLHVQDKVEEEHEYSELDQCTCGNVLNNIKQEPNGRMVVPLIWHD